MSTCATVIPCLEPLKRGDTWEIQFAWTAASGEALDLTDYTGRMQVRTKRTKELVIEADDVVLDADPTTGIVTAVFDATGTAGVTPGDYYTDLEMTSATGKVSSTGTLELIVDEDQTLPVTP